MSIHCIQLLILPNIWMKLSYPCDAVTDVGSLAHLHVKANTTQQYNVMDTLRFMCLDSSTI